MSNELHMGESECDELDKLHLDSKCRCVACHMRILQEFLNELADRQVLSAMTKIIRENPEKMPGVVERWEEKYPGMSDVERDNKIAAELHDYDFELDHEIVNGNFRPEHALTAEEVTELKSCLTVELKP